MIKEPFVSAITIFFNEEKFIREAIESVFAQTYENWELILVDDGSTDRSTQIARQYAEKFSGKVRYLEHHNHENRGMSASRNLGVRNAKGSHIAYLDGDDVWMPDLLERQVAILESHPGAVMLSAPLQLWHSWSGNPGDKHRDCILEVGDDGLHPFSDRLVKPPGLLCLFLRNELFIPGSVLMKRKAISDVGGYEDRFRDGYSDAAVFVKICLTSPVFISSECGYKYRKHQGSYTYQSYHNDEDDTSRELYLNWVSNYLSEQKVRDPNVWKALNYARRIHRHPKLYRMQEKVLRLGYRILPDPLTNMVKTFWRAMADRINKSAF
ncbi:glycosyltransferase [Desulfococcaceae bacterium HSG8]|nr:glycosyltransferase [Desulfococcaceae bacterium HSG8]